MNSSFFTDPRFGLALVAIIAGGLIRGFTGFGSALVIIPTLALLFGPREAVVMHSIMEIPVVIALMPNALKNAQSSITTPMVLTLALTTPIGATVLAFIDAGLLKIMISAVILCMVALLAFQRQVSAFLSRASAMAAGAVGGLLQGATGIGGPPIVLALMARGDNARVSRANIIVVASVVVIASFLSFLAFGLITTKILILGAIASPLSVATTYLGTVLFKQVGSVTHRNVTLVVLACTAVWTLITATMPLG